MHVIHLLNVFHNPVYVIIHIYAFIILYIYIILYHIVEVIHMLYIYIYQQRLWDILLKITRAFL